MAGLLLFFIYLIFTSYGLPSAMLGAAWPAASAGLGVSTAAAGLVSALSTTGTILASLLSSRVLKRLGTGRTVAFGGLITASAMLTYSLAPGYAVFCLAALPIGFAGGSIDAAINNFVATRYRGAYLNFLHAFWGVGATLGPLILSAGMAAGSWRLGYRAVSLIQYGVAALMLFIIPLWGRIASAADAERIPQVLSYRTVLKKPGAKLGMLSFLCYSGGETILNLWAATYFVSTLGLREAEAARCGSFMFAGMMAGRFLSGFLALKFRPEKLIRLGIALALAGTAPILFNLPKTIQFIGVVLMGLGYAPQYPGFVQLTPKRFGLECSQSMLGLEMAASNFGAMCLAPLFGLVAGATTFRLFPYVLIAFLAAEWAIQGRLNRLTEGNNAYDRSI